MGGTERVCPQCIGCSCQTGKSVETNFLRCDYPKGVYTMAENCAVCQNRFQTPETMTPFIKKLIGSNIIDCLECSDEISYPATEEECIKCPNRKYENGYCSLKNCPKGSFQQREGACWPCSTIAIADVKSLEDCNACPEREFKDGKCTLKECPNSYMMNPQGECISCNIIKSIKSANLGDCDKCPNREYSDGFCKMKCPLENYIDGKCKSNCGKNQFQDLYGNCWGCDGPVLVDTSREECQKCPNRLYYGKCQLLQ